MEDSRKDDARRKHSEHDDRLFRRKDSGNDRRIRTKPEGYTDFDDVNSREQDSNSRGNQTSQGTRQRQSIPEDNWDSRRERDNRRRYDDRGDYNSSRRTRDRDDTRRGGRYRREDTSQYSDSNNNNYNGNNSDNDPRARAEASRRAHSMRSDPESGEDVPKRRKGRGSFAMRGRRTPTPDRGVRRAGSNRDVGRDSRYVGRDSREVGRDRGRGEYNRGDRRPGERRMGVKSQRGGGAGGRNGNVRRGGREWDQDRTRDREYDQRSEDWGRNADSRNRREDRIRDSREQSRGRGYNNGRRESVSSDDSDALSDVNDGIDVDSDGEDNDVVDSGEGAESDNADVGGQPGRSVFDRLGGGARDGNEGAAEGGGRSLASRINVRDRLRVGYKSKTSDIAGDDDDDDELEVDTEIREDNRRRARDNRRDRRAEDRNAHRVIQSINPDTALNTEPSDFDALLTNVLERVEPESRKFIEPRPDCHSASVCRDHALLQYGTDAWTTRDVFEYWTGLDPKFVEWVNDSSVCVVFESEAKAEAARLATSTAILASDYVETLKITQEFVPEDTRLYWRNGKDFKDWSDILIRFASTSDIKRVGAWKDSQFYKKQQEIDKKKSEMALDAELDEIATGDYSATRAGSGPNNESDPVFGNSGRGRYVRGRGGARGRGRGGIGGRMSAAERQAQLDKELDDFIAGDDDIITEKTTDEPEAEGTAPSEVEALYEAPDDDTEMLMD